jgi:hypothetical protein
MSEFYYVGFLLVGFVLLYQIYVSVVIYRAAEYEQIQRFLQIFFVWLFPLFGAIGFHLFLRNQRRNVLGEDLRFVPQPPNDAGPMD